MTRDAVMSKVPAVTLTFWIVKILATTLGETAGDTLSMTLELGYLASTAIFLSTLVFIRSSIGRRSSPRPRRERRWLISPIGPWASVIWAGR